MNGIVSLYFLIPAIFLIILVFPIFAEIRVSFNPFYNRGVVALFIFGFKVFYFIVSFHGTYIMLENEQETKKQQLDFSSQQFAVMEEFGKQIKDKIKLKKLYIFYNIGTADAFSSAMICGYINFFITQIFLYLKSYKPTASFCIYDTVSYNKQEFELAGRLSVSISFFDVVYSYLHSVIITYKK